MDGTVTAGQRRQRRKKKLKPVGIYEYLGIALGCIRLSYNDFCNMDFAEFAAIYKAYTERRETDYKNAWERTRMLAAIVIQPHLKRKITPDKLLPFPWDKKKPKAGGPEKSLTPAEQRARMEKLVTKVSHFLYTTLCLV